MRHKDKNFLNFSAQYVSNRQKHFKNTMKRIIFILSAALLICGASQVSFAQGQGRGRGRAQMSPEEIAKRTVERLDKVVSLTDKQYKKIYKFHLSMAEEQMEERGFGGYGDFGGRPDGGPRGDFGDRPQRTDRPAVGQDSARRQRPQMTEEQRAEMAQRHQEMMERRKEMMEERAAEEAERQATIDKKYKKVLTAEQYDAWKAHEAEQAARREQMAKERQERMRQQRGNHGGHGNHNGPRQQRPADTILPVQPAIQ